MPHSILNADRRITKTRTALRKAMMTLLAEHGWDNLSIQAICDEANVGRSTFYQHYSSKNELMIESLGELRDMLINTTAHLPEGPLEGVLSGVLNHMVEQLPVFRKVIGRRSSLLVATNFRNMLIELIELDLNRHQHVAATNPMTIRFLAGGIHEAMIWWSDATAPCAIGDLDKGLSELIKSALVE